MPDWKAWKMWRSCSRKKLRFKHEGQANREAHARGMSAYKCKYCDNWHLTSQLNQYKL